MSDRWHYRLPDAQLPTETPPFRRAPPLGEDGGRRQTDAAYGQLASVVVADSNQTGSRLSALMASAGRLADGPVAPNPSGVQPL